MAVTSMSEFDPPPDAPPLTTKEGWNRWVGRDRSAPELRGDWCELAPSERADYDDTRLDYHSELIVVNTPAIQDITKTVRRLLILNRRQISARRGLIVTGGAGTGKTTALTQLGLAHELRTRLRNPVRGTRIPVVYITLPPRLRLRAWSRSNSRGSSVSRSRAAPISPTSLIPSARSSATSAAIWSSSMRSTTFR